ncbi:MAG: alpha/beta hydrolase [Planctomycetia bacterium]|jgi:pimeloyl-ACP methyl ester carboxylesterase
MSRKRFFPLLRCPAGGVCRWRACAGGLLVIVAADLGAVPPVHVTGADIAAAEEPAAPEPAAEADGKQPAPAPSAEEIELETSDGVLLTAWHYPGDASIPAAERPCVILLHDLGGSRKGVEPLARRLQGIGCDVVVPDLRGHGASVTKRVGDRETKIDTKLLKPTDIEFIAASRGGTLREQALHRGDIETTRNWMVTQGMPLDRLYVIGVGLGAGLAAAWTAEDAGWPGLVTGPQGKQVRGLVMIDPPMASRGISMAKPLEQETLRHSTPILILGGRNDKDFNRVFDQLKRHRPQSWFRKPVKGEAERAEKLEDAKKATLYSIEVDAPLAGEKLAAETAVAEAVETFLSLTKPSPKPRR